MIKILFKILLGIFYSFSLFASNHQSLAGSEKESLSRDNFQKKEEELYFFKHFYLVKERLEVEKLHSNNQNLCANYCSCYKKNNNSK